MALKYSASTAAAIAHQTFISSAIADTTASRGVSLHSGQRPTASTLSSQWSSYNADSSSFLWYRQNIVLTRLAPPASVIFATSESLATTATPLRNGTATWGVIWISNPTLVSLQASTIASPDFIIVDVTDLTADGVIKLVSTSLSTSTAVTLSDLGLRVNVVS